MNLKGKNSNTSSKNQRSSSVVVSDTVGSYEKHPFFIKKAAAAKALLHKVGLPKQLAKKSHS